MKHAVWLFLVPLALCSLAACCSTRGGDPQVTALDSLWAKWRSPGLGEEGIRQAIYECRDEDLADLVVFLVSSPRADSNTATCIRNALEKRDPWWDNEVWGVWAWLAPIADVAPEDVTEEMSPRKVLNPFLIVRNLRAGLTLGVFRDEAVAAAKVMFASYEKDCLRLRTRPGLTGIHRTPCIMRLRRALEIILQEAD